MDNWKWSQEAQNIWIHLLKGLIMVLNHDAMREWNVSLRIEKVSLELSKIFIWKESNIFVCIVRPERWGDGGEEDEEAENVESARHDWDLGVSSLLSRLRLSSTTHRPSWNHRLSCSLWHQDCQGLIHSPVLESGKDDIKREKIGKLLGGFNTFFSLWVLGVQFFFCLLI